MSTGRSIPSELLQIILNLLNDSEVVRFRRLCREANVIVNTRASFLNHFKATLNQRWNAPFHPRTETDRSNVIRAKHLEELGCLERQFLKQLKLDLPSFPLTRASHWLCCWSKELQDVAAEVVCAQHKNLFPYASTEYLDTFQAVHCHMVDVNQNQARIPASLGSLVFLTTVDLSDSNLHGPIPLEFFGIKSLKHLDLSGNLLRQDFPVEINRLANLAHLNLSFNGFTGPLPSTLTEMRHLSYINISHNYITSMPPIDTIKKMTRLHHINLEHNLIDTPFPETLFALNGIHHINLSQNRITGPLPPRLHASQNLHTLNLSHNRLSGPLPLNIRNWVKLTTLNLASNTFDGRIPSDLRNLKHLHTINLARNKFRGPIPCLRNAVNQKQWQYLGMLDVSCNRLSGHLPVNLSKLPKLQTLNVSHNEFCGEVPKGLGEVKGQPFFHEFLCGGNKGLEVRLPKSLGTCKHLSSVCGLKGVSYIMCIECQFHGMAGTRRSVVRGIEEGEWVRRNCGEFREVVKLEAKKIIEGEEKLRKMKQKIRDGLKGKASMYEWNKAG
ncbi:RNI-like protein [Rhizoclosmatium globosum]|uniref:RNI-like protein n=1 Tax=Rhizoclosmatium globosum TaxID=329046 RepID=A0A1Y2C4Z6_9FUNG|nr:RNI-like protein [Rhizoclosmatium globosum]|eukprot:ORY42016.1 RNI-like protein [Rhizoclosmatium globosum]